MDTVTTVATMEELRAVLESTPWTSGGVFSKATIAVKPYAYDSRIDWDTHIVTVNGNAVGFTDGPLR